MSHLLRPWAVRLSAGQCSARDKILHLAAGHGIQIAALLDADDRPGRHVALAAAPYFPSSHEAPGLAGIRFYSVHPLQAHRKVHPLFFAEAVITAGPRGLLVAANSLLDQTDRALSQPFTRHVLAQTLRYRYQHDLLHLQRYSHNRSTWSKHSHAMPRNLDQMARVIASLDRLEARGLYFWDGTLTNPFVDLSASSIGRLDHLATLSALARLPATTETVSGAREAIRAIALRPEERVVVIPGLPPDACEAFSLGYDEVYREVRESAPALPAVSFREQAPANHRGAPYHWAAPLDLSARTPESLLPMPATTENEEEFV